MLWKNKTCGECLNQVEAPRPPGVPDLKAPKNYICRARPPQALYAIGQSGDGRPFPAMLGSGYPMVGEDFPACADFKTLHLDS